jgi:hypothetical protein
MVRDVTNDSGTSPDHDVLSNFYTLDDLASDSNPRAIADRNIATQMNSWAYVYEIANPAIMVHGSASVDDAMRANLSANLDHSPGAHNRTWTNDALRVDPRMNMRCNSPQHAGKFECNHPSDPTIANTNNGLRTGQLAEIVKRPQHGKPCNARPA